MQYLVNISSICTNDLQKKMVPNFKIVIILEMLISILLYRKQEQFLTTIVFYHQLFSYGMDYHWKQNVLNFSHF